MIIPYTPPDQETQDAWDARVTEFNSRTGNSVSLADFILQYVITPQAEQLKRQRYDSAVNEIGTLAQALSYPDRLDLITELKDRFAV